MSDSTIRGLASIIIPAWNQVGFTQQCVAALRSHTRPPWELIIVDNGSSDETGIYLAGVRDMADVPVTVITNTTNLGFPAAINQGLRVARGEYLVLLNNDVVVTDSWLDQLTALANVKTGVTAEHAEHAERKTEKERRVGRMDLVDLAERHNFKIVDLDGQAGIEESADLVAGHAGSAPPLPPAGLVVGSAEPTPPLPSADLVVGRAGPSPPDPAFARGGKRGSRRACSEIGLVGPMSNYAAPPQLVAGVTYRDMGEMPGFARRWRDEHRGQWFTLPKLSGFCLLMKRAVYDKIGGLDERCGLGFFDDDDLAERAKRAGYELAVAHDLFVHHFGSRTFAANGIDAEKLLDENARRFAAKWGLRETGGQRVTLRPFVEPARGDSSPTNGSSADHHTNPPRQQGSPRLVRGTGMAPSGQQGLPRRVCGIDMSPSLARRVGVPPAPAAAADASSAVLPCSPADRARVSLTMIVKDEEKNLSACLESVRGVFDEIVIVDTGSTDRTVEIARSFGAEVFHFVWVDSFSAARNEALAHATGDYAFWLDADDVVEPVEKEKLQALLGSLRRAVDGADELGVGASADERATGAESPSPALRAPSPRRGEGDAALARDDGPARVPPSGGFFSPSIHQNSPPQGGTPTGRTSPPEGGTPAGAAYVVRCACDPSPDGTGGETVVDHIRLFPLRDDVRWTYRVHEQFLPALRSANVPVRWTDLTVRHAGYVDLELRARKLERDVRLLRLDLEEHPDEPFILFNLGAIAIERHEWHEALGFLERSLARSAPTDSIVRKLFALIARAHQMLGDSRAALHTCARGLQLDPDDAELWFRKAVVHRYRGESFEAEQSWRRILGLRRPDQFCSVDQGIYGHLTRRNLAMLAAERGDQAEFERLQNDVPAECPGDREALARLGRGRVPMQVARET